MPPTAIARRPRRRLPRFGPLALITFAALVAMPRPGRAEPAEAPTPPPARKIEVGIVPLAGGSTDVGIGVGELSTIAALPPEYAPYRWAIDSAAFISFKGDPSMRHSFLLPYQDYFVQWTAQLLGKRLRMEARASFTRETTQHFYGLGNAAPAPKDDVAS